MLTYFPAGLAPNIDALHNGAQVNNDGHGYALIVAGRLVIGRGMSGDTVLAEFTAVRRQHPEGPALFHSRYATHGGLSIENCHPFHIGADARTVLAHNGIPPSTVQPTKEDPRSDTRIAAEDFLPHTPFGSLATRHGRRCMEKWLVQDHGL